MTAWIVGRAARRCIIPAAMLLAIGSLWPTPATANPVGPGCQSLVDLAARMECPRWAQVGRVPPQAPRAQPRHCTPAVPCSDRAGGDDIAPFGETRYL
jgi:hypothetical protein